jgi:hypothetical protein
MKHFILFFTIFLIASSCKEQSSQDKKISEPGTSTTAEQTVAKKIQLVGQVKEIVDWYWWYEGYVSQNEEYMKAQRGKWFKLKQDGTFDYGKFQEIIGTGTWRFDDRTKTIYIQTEDGKETRQWETVMNNTSDIMIWKGPVTGPNAGDQAKLVRYLQMPRDQDLPF